MVAHVGPTALWPAGPSPSPAVDERVVPDDAVVDRMAALLTVLDDLDPFAFTGDLFPGVGDGDAIDWFTAATLQQYGFWHDRNGRYDRPMIARIDGITRKGSDYLWAQYRREHAADPSSLGVLEAPAAYGADLVTGDAAKVSVVRVICVRK